MPLSYTRLPYDAGFTDAIILLCPLFVEYPDHYLPWLTHGSSILGGCRFPFNANHGFKLLLLSPMPYTSHRDGLNRP